MGWKKKETRKYAPRNEFRRNKSPSASGHHDYVFGETKTHYKSLGLTTTEPKEGKRYYKLKTNPNPNDKRTSYLQLNVRNTNKKYFGEKNAGWAFDKEDMPIVRYTIRDYKKRTNRNPKNYYQKKRKKNK